MSIVQALRDEINFRTLSRVKITLLSERQADISAKIWLKFLNMYTIRERKKNMKTRITFLGCLFTERRCLHRPIDLALYENSEKQWKIINVCIFHFYLSINLLIKINHPILNLRNWPFVFICSKPFEK